MRLWESSGNGKPAWRASLEDPRTGSRKGFASLEALFAFLEAETSETARPSDAGSDEPDAVRRT
ncbi:MAG: hypothetical protein ACE5LU_21680 [Anaerolineae bacterium]